eukprot:365126-Chlamydomonas_euryale.AAC.51
MHRQLSDRVGSRMQRAVGTYDDSHYTGTCPWAPKLTKQHIALGCHSMVMKCCKMCWSVTHGWKGVPAGHRGRSARGRGGGGGRSSHMQ